MFKDDKNADKINVIFDKNLHFFFLDDNIKKTASKFILLSAVSRCRSFLLFAIST